MVPGKANASKYSALLQRKQDSAIDNDMQMLKEGLLEASIVQSPIPESQCLMLLLLFFFSSAVQCRLQRLTEKSKMRPIQKFSAVLLQDWARWAPMSLGHWGRTRPSLQRRQWRQGVTFSIPLGTLLDFGLASKKDGHELRQAARSC